MTTPRRLQHARRLAAVAAVAALTSGCISGTGNADEPTLPPGTPTASTPAPTTSPSPTPVPSTTPPPDVDTPMPTDVELVDLVNAYRNITLDLPEMPVDQARQHAAERTAELTTPDGSARQLMDGAISDTGLIIRGRPYTTILTRPHPDGPEWTTTACIATRARTTEIATGNNTEDDGFTSDYTEVDLRVAPADDGGWLLAEYVPAGDENRCIPPATLEAIQSNWDEVHGLLLRWANNGQPAEGLEPIGRVVTDDYLATLQRAVGENTTSHDPAVETRSGFEVMYATPREVRARWCYDLSLDPSARSTENSTGEVTDLSLQEPLVVAATWHRDEDVWRHGTPEVLEAEEGGGGPCS